ncbi:MAG: MucB/RseB C-terminal domain-containing protein [Limnobacter sp.]|nr:MucB/RseB C-terminal domain-containing protein [Limnobacter sp.]
MGFAPGSQAADETALWTLVSQTHEKARLLNYSGFLSTKSGEHTQNSRVEHFATPEGEFELIEKLDGQPSRWIRHNDQIQCIIPDRKLILSEKRQINSSFPRVFTNADGSASLAQFYTIDELSPRRVAGRQARVMRLLPKDQMRYEYRLFVDKEHSLLLRSESYSRQGELLERVGFSEINFSSDLSKKPALIEAGPGWKEASTKILPIDDRKLPYALPQSMHGFSKINAFCRMKDNNLEVHQAVFSDGLATLSVFIQKAQAGQTLPSVPMSHGAVMSKSEIQGTHLVTVLGEVPVVTLDTFLKSVKWKSQ